MYHHNVLGMFLSYNLLNIQKRLHSIKYFPLSLVIKRKYPTLGDGVGVSQLCLLTPRVLVLSVQPQPSGEQTHHSSPGGYDWHFTFSTDLTELQSASSITGELWPGTERYRAAPFTCGSLWELYLCFLFAFYTLYVIPRKPFLYFFSF